MSDVSVYITQQLNTLEVNKRQTSSPQVNGFIPHTGCVEHKCSLQLAGPVSIGELKWDRVVKLMCMCVKISSLFQYLKFMLC